jgi:YaiO family outer membrane protein
VSLRLVALCASVCSVPVAAQPAAAPYQQAVAARLRGDAAEAVRLLQPIVATDPRNSDAQVQLGYALLALGRLGEAEQAFRAALAVAPGYADAQLGLARVAQRRGDSAAVRRELAPLDPSNPDVRTLRSQLAAGTAEAAWSLDLDGNYSFLQGPQPDWKEGSLQIRRRFDADRAASGRIEVSRRFDRADVYLEAGVEQAIGSRARVYATLGGTPSADFRPEWQLGAGGSLRVTDGGAATVLTLDARHAEFPAGDVQTLTPGVEQYLVGGRVWVTARWINLFDEAGDHQSGYLVRGDLQASDRLRLFVGHSDAPDTSEGVVIDTRSYFGGFSYDLSARITARLSVAFEDRDTGSDRTQIGLGFGWRF